MRPYQLPYWILNTMQKEPPLLSVVIPFYNVAPLLGECISSVLNQDYHNLEVILVNDGSTDGSIGIAEYFASKDSRIRLINIENSGPGRARNVGTDAAHGDFIAYVDSDDFIHPKAHDLLITSLIESGSDFATGDVRRLMNGKLETTTIHARAIRKTVKSTSLHLSPELIYDITVWNKVFRTEFVRTKVGPFPEGMLYEDIQPMNRAYTRAASIDVIKEVIYYWRVRNDKSSITQSREQLQTLIDRVNAITATRAELSADTDLWDIVPHFDAKTLTIDFPIYMRVCSSLDENYKNYLFDALQEFLGAIDPNLVLTRITPLWRSVYLLLLNDQRHVVEHFLSTHAKPDDQLLTQQVGGRFFAQLPLSVDGTKRTDLLFDTTDSLRKVIKKTSHWPLPSGAIFNFQAYIDRVSLSEPSSSSIKVWAVVRNTSIHIPIPVTRTYVKGVAAKSATSPDYSWSGFQIRIDYNALRQHALVRNAILDFYFSLTIGDFTWSDRLPFNYGKTSLKLFRGFLLGAKARYYSTLDKRLAVELRKHNALTALYTRVKKAIYRRAKGAILWLTSKLNRVVADVPKPDRVIPASSLTLDQGKLTITVPHQDGLKSLILQPIDGGQDFPLLTTARESNNIGMIDLTLVDRAPGVVASLPAGDYLVYGRDQDDVKTLFTLPEKSSKMASKSGELSFTATSGTLNSIVLRVRSKLPPHESGKVNQARLEKVVYAAAREKPVRPIILFESWGGKRIDDHPKAIHDAIRRTTNEYELLFVVRDATVPVPDGVSTVRKFSASFYAAMGEASAIVTNNDLPRQFVSRDGQIVLQTWHGTPLKKIGHDIAEVQFYNKNYLDELPEQVAKWNALVSPTPYVTELFRSAFKFYGEVVEVGSPRLDLLSSSAASAERRRLRHLFNIPEGATVALYAPTWRDNQYSGHGKYGFKQALDLKYLIDRNQNLYILMRRHHQLSVPLSIAKSPRLIEASFYPDITDLYAMSDLMITDYSSTMVDFAVTKRPMICFAPDIVDYRDNLRGFYIDFENVIPCPLVRTKEEVNSILMDVDTAMAPFHQKYQEWIHRYVANEDGHASERVAKWLLSAIRKEAEKTTMTKEPL